MEKPKPQEYPAEMAGQLLPKFVSEIWRVKDDPRLLMLVTHGVLELFVNTIIDARCKNAKRITSDSRGYATLIKAAKVRTIKFHGLRHTCATLLLQAGQPVHVVSERLGHAKVSMTMEGYAHVLPDMQQEAATVMGGLLHG